MKTYYLRMRFQIVAKNINAPGWVERTVAVRATDILAAAHDAEHIANGYRLGTGLAADCDGVHLSNRGPVLETRSDFADAYPLNDNSEPTT
tara:strand:+ start:320 stop:592 length:273 start_codon:yes stop_codon:yes gene_type:complete